MTKIVLGFDVSSACTAWGAVSISSSNKISYINSGFITPPDGEDIIERLQITRDKIKEVLSQINPTDIAIENIIEFMKGSSGSKTIIMLTSFNRMVALACKDFLGTSPIPYAVGSIRHGLKLNGRKDIPAKEEMPELVAEHLNIKFPYETKTIKKTGEVKILIPSYDKADALAVAIKHSLILTGKQKAPKKETKEEKKIKRAKKKAKLNGSV